MKKIFLHKNIWIDLIALICLWTLALNLPKDLYLLSEISISSITRIAALVGSFQLGSFIAFSLAGHRIGLLVQGLLGGFVSSTTTFVQFTHDEKFQCQPAHLLCKGLFLATTAMLTECLFLIFLIQPNAFLQLGLPVIIQIIIILLVIAFWNPRSESLDGLRTPSPQMEQKPIVWKSVLQLTGLIVLLIYGTRFLNQQLSLPYYVSSLILALFEAHGVLAAALSNLTSEEVFSEGTRIILAVLGGSTFSKCILALRSPQKKVGLFVSTILLIAFACSALATVFL